ncbi:hypothetical protein TNCV_339771 [Trichonephila clavipes]|nr:hypothetical protein TNCV_339771 [Trichonephila clavipes]
MFIAVVKYFHPAIKTRPLWPFSWHPWRLLQRVTSFSSCSAVLDAILPCRPLVLVHIRRTCLYTRCRCTFHRKCFPKRIDTLKGYLLPHSDTTDVRLGCVCREHPRHRSETIRHISWDRRPDNHPWQRIYTLFWDQRFCVEC